jgi:hypothetical protein
MNQRIFTRLMVLILILFAFTPAIAQEERKTLKELLFEKGLITKDEAASIQEVKIAKWIDGLLSAATYACVTTLYNIIITPDRGRAVPPRFEAILLLKFLWLPPGFRREANIHKPEHGQPVQSKTDLDLGFPSWRANDWPA